MPSRRILFAIRDPEARRQPGLLKAIQVARALDASLELFHALTDHIINELALLEDDTVDKLRERVEWEARIPLIRLCGVARKHGVPANYSADWDYPAHEAVIRRAAAIGALLIIAECHHGSTHGPGSLHRTDRELLRTSPLPVLLMRSARPWRRPLLLAAVDPSHSPPKPSGLDAQVMTMARSLTTGLQARLHVLHSIHPTLAAIRGIRIARVPSAWSTVTYARFRGEARSAFETLLANEEIPASNAHLVSGDPARAIRREAARLKADIVLAGSVSHSGLKRVLLGSTAERLLDSLACDVLVVKPPRYVTRVRQQTRGMRVLAPREALITSAS